MDQRHAPEHVRRREGPVFFDEGRAADRHVELIDQLFDLKGFIVRRIDRKVADRSVDAVGCEIGVVDRRGNAHVDFGTGDRKSVEPRRQPFRGEAGRRADHEHARVAQRIEARQRVADKKEARLQAGEERLACRRQGDRPHAAVEQFEAQMILQSANLVAQGSGRDVQLQRRLGQAEMPGGGFESAKRVKRGRSAMHESVSSVS